MDVKYGTSSSAKPYKIYPVWNFGFKNMPSGNPEVAIT
jgi:hypothetical protein